MYVYLMDSQIIEKYVEQNVLQDKSKNQRCFSDYLLQLFMISKKFPLWVNPLVPETFFPSYFEI